MWHNPALAPDPAKLTVDQLKIIASNRVALSLYGWDPYLHNPKLKSRLHRIDVPTLVIWGASDGLVKPSYGRAYAELIPGAKFVQIEQAGHAPHVEQPEAFAKHVLAFAA